MSLPPGRESFAAVTAARPAELSPAELTDLIVASDRLICHLQALQITAVAEFSQPGRSGNMQKLIDSLVDKTGLTTRSDGTIDDFAVHCLIVERAQSMAAAEIGAALHQSPIGASRRVTDAVELVHELPATLTALREGNIDLPRTRTIAHRTALLTPEVRTRVATAVLPLTRTRTPGQLTPMIDRRVTAADPAASEKRAVAARRDRFVDHYPSVDGMGMIRAHLPAEGALTVYDLLDRIARATAGTDDRPIAARRADAFTDICTQLLTDGYVEVTDMHRPHRAPNTTPTTAAKVATNPAGSDPAAVAPATPVTPTAPEAPTAAPTGKVRLSKVSKHQGRGAHFNLTMTLSAFTQFNSDPAELIGHGIIPAHIAVATATSLRSLAVIITNTHGHALAIGATTYLPTQHTRDQVTTAAGTCRFPSCRINSLHTDLDHRQPFNHHHPEQGGHTTPDCMDPACRHHHLLKTFTHWTPQPDPADGLTMNWTSPTHHHHPDHPKEHTLPDTETTPNLHPAPDNDQHPADPDSTQRTGSTDPDNLDSADPDTPQACTCTCGHGNAVTDGLSTAQTQAQQATLLIARTKQREAEAADTRERERLFLADPPHRVHYIGPKPTPIPEDDRTDEQVAADLDEYIATFDSYQHFHTAELKLNKRLDPMLYAIQMAQDHQRQHPDPDKPPF